MPLFLLLHSRTEDLRWHQEGLHKTGKEFADANHWRRNISLHPRICLTRSKLLFFAHGCMFRQLSVKKIRCHLVFNNSIFCFRE